MSDHTRMLRTIWQRREQLLLQAWARAPAQARRSLRAWLAADGPPPAPVPPFVAFVWQRHAAAARRWWEAYDRALAQPGLRARLEAEAAACTALTQARGTLEEAQQVLAKLQHALPVPDRAPRP